MIQYIRDRGNNRRTGRRVEQASNETPEALSQQPKLHAKTERAKEIAKVAFNTAIEKVKRGYPKCSVKQIP